MLRSRSKLVAILCLVLLPAAVVAEDAKAILTPSGNVTVNGKAAKANTPIFDGDKIVVGPGSAAGITGRGATITLDADSSATYMSQNFDVGCGTTVIGSSGVPMTAIINGIEVSFGAQPAKVQLSDKDGVTLIKSLSGTAQVKEAGSSSTLAEGFSLARPGSPTCAAPAPPTTAENKTTPAAKKPNHTIAIVAGVGAGAAIIGAVAGKGGGSSSNSNTGPISPSVP